MEQPASAPVGALVAARLRDPGVAGPGRAFRGTVIARRPGSFTVRRVVRGQGVERSFPTASPRLASVEVERRGAVRRAKLYYLRDRSPGAAVLPEVAPAAQPKGRRKRGARAKALRQARAAAQDRRRPPDEGATGVLARLRPTDPPRVPPGQRRARHR